MLTKPEILKYQNVVLFLQGYYEFRKKQDNSFSYTVWARELGVKNRAYLRLVVMGERPISESLMMTLAEAMQMSSREKDYFSALINYNQSRNSEQRKAFGKKLLAFQLNDEDFLEVENHYDFLSDELLPRIQTLLSFEDLAKDSEKAARILGISSEEYHQSCLKLEKLGLIERNGEKLPLTWIVKRKSWRMPNQFKDMGYKEFYSAALKRAVAAIDKFESHERRFRNLFVAMNESEFQDFLKDFEVFVQEQLSKRNVDFMSDRRLYQLNFSFFPNTEACRKDESTV